MLLEIITPEKSLFKGEVNSVSLPGLDGVFQVLNHHAPIISSLRSGELRFEAANTVEAAEFLEISGTTVSVQIKGGVAELNNQKLIVLAE